MGVIFMENLLDTLDAQLNSEAIGLLVSRLGYFSDWTLGG